MSKFCKNCGTELADEAAFCKNCGTSTAAETVVAEAPAETKTEEPACNCAECNGECAQQEAPVEKEAGVAGAVNGFINKLKNKDKNALLITGGAVLALVLILVIAIVFSGSGPEDAFDNYFEATFEYNSGVVEDLAPEAYWEYLDDEKNIELADIEDLVDNEDYYDYTMEVFEELVGKDVSFSYDIIETDEVGKKDLDNIKDGLKSKYDIAKKDVGEAVEIEVEIFIEGDDDEEEQEMTVYAVEIDGDWYPCTANGKLLVDEIVSMLSTIETLEGLDSLGDLSDALGDLSDLLG